MPADGLGPPPPQRTPRPGVLHITSRHRLPPHVSSDGSFKNQGKKRRKKSPLPNEITRVVQSHGPTGTCLVIQQEAKQRMETRWEIFLWFTAVTVCCPLAPRPARLCVGCAGCPAPSRGKPYKIPNLLLTSERFSMPSAGAAAARLCWVCSVLAQTAVSGMVCKDLWGVPVATCKAQRKTVL